MGRSRKKLTGFHQTILQKTSFEKSETNFLLKTVDTKGKVINYIVPEYLLKSYIEKIMEYAIITGEITHREAIEVLFKDIFSVYKTKVATVRVTLLILNMMVKEELLYSDNNEDYKLIKNPEVLKQWFCDFFNNKNNT
jgi:hypothetical protein